MPVLIQWDSSIHAVRVTTPRASHAIVNFLFSHHSYRQRFEVYRNGVFYGRWENCAGMTYRVTTELPASADGDYVIVPIYNRSQCATPPTTDLHTDATGFGDPNKAMLYVLETAPNASNSSETDTYGVNILLVDETYG
jgi:hypothetical protein